MFANGAGERVTLAIVLALVICFIAFLFVGQSRPTNVITGEPNDKITLWQGTSPPQVSQSRDGIVLSKDIRSQAVRESGLP